MSTKETIRILDERLERSEELGAAMDRSGDKAVSALRRAAASARAAEQRNRAAAAASARAAEQRNRAAAAAASAVR